MKHDVRLASARCRPAASFVPPPFTLALDREARLLRWTLHGFWETEDARAFMAAMRAAVVSLGAPPQRWNGLGDARDFPIQSAAVGAILRRGPGAALRQEGRIAIVVGSVLGKLQAQRALDDGKTRCFLTLEEARAWLDLDPA